MCIILGFVALILAVAACVNLYDPEGPGAIAEFGRIIVSPLAVPFQVLLVIFGTVDVHDVGPPAILLGVVSAEAIILAILFNLARGRKRGKTRRPQRSRLP
jgi:hypothetical protein